MAKGSVVDVKSCKIPVVAKVLAQDKLRTWDWPTDKLRGYIFSELVYDEVVNFTPREDMEF